MSNTIRIASVVDDSIVDGPGIRYTIFTQGCLHNCAGCHNPTTHDINGGKLVDIDDLFKNIEENPLLDGITLSGGDPFYQPEACAIIASRAHLLGLNVFCYTGFIYEKLLEMAKDNQGIKDLLENSDYLVDGPFILEKRDLTLLFRGSTNQRIIDVKESLKTGKVVLFDESK